MEQDNNQDFRKSCSMTIHEWQTKKGDITMRNIACSFMVISPSFLIKLTNSSYWNIFHSHSSTVNIVPSCSCTVNIICSHSISFVHKNYHSRLFIFLFSENEWDLFIVHYHLLLLHATYIVHFLHCQDFFDWMGWYGMVTRF